MCRLEGSDRRTFHQYIQGWGRGNQAIAPPSRDKMTKESPRPGFQIPAPMTPKSRMNLSQSVKVWILRDPWLGTPCPRHQFRHRNFVTEISSPEFRHQNFVTFVKCQTFSLERAFLDEVGLNHSPHPDNFPILHSSYKAMEKFPDLGDNFVDNSVHFVDNSGDNVADNSVASSSDYDKSQSPPLISPRQD